MSRLVARAPRPNCVSNVSTAKFDLSVVAHDLIGCSMETKVRKIPGRLIRGSCERKANGIVVAFLTPIYLLQLQ
jgi:hypothetical protein